MIDIIKLLKKHFTRHLYDTTNSTFKLLCQVNVTILLFCCALVLSKQVFGDAVDCGGDRPPLKAESINAFCWVMGLYVQKGFTGVLTNKTQSAGYITGPLYGERIYLRYYQWLVFIYFIMAASFRFPAFLWRLTEGGRLQGICEGLDIPLYERNWTKERRSEILSYFLAAGTRRVHTWYAFKFFMCQILLLFISIINIVAIDKIFFGFWEKYYEAMAALYPFNYDAFVERTALIFPRMAKCEYLNYGPSGSGQKLDALCLLPLNIVNEKIFIFLFFWLLLMTIVAACSVFYSFLVIISSWLRIRILAMQSDNVPVNKIKRATDNGSWGDFFVLHLIGKNINHCVFKDLLLELAKCKINGTKFEEIDV